MSSNEVADAAGFVGDAEDKLALLRAQYKGRFNFHRPSGSTLFVLDFGFAGVSEQVVRDNHRVMLSGNHQALMYLPVGFPAQAPSLIWLTPIFHPDLYPQRQVWPPRFAWEQAPRIPALLGALIETLVGLRADVGRFRGLLGGESEGRRASSWYRKNRSAVTAFGESQLLSTSSLGGAFPLDLPNAGWRLVGRVGGAEPVVFLSQGAQRAFSSQGFGPGWLAGTGGKRGGEDWVYVERVVSADVGGQPPQGAVGVLGAIDGRPEVLGRGEPFLRATAKPDGTGPRIEFGGHELSGHFVGQLGTGDTDGSDLPKIRVDAEPTAGDCPYCRGPLTGSDEWHPCPSCEVAAHGTCRERLTGCPNTACADSPLRSGGR
jgi:hypothetical protein